MAVLYVYGKGPSRSQFANDGVKYSTRVATFLELLIRNRAANGRETHKVRSPSPGKLVRSRRTACQHMKKKKATALKKRASWGAEILQS